MLADTAVLGQFIMHYPITRRMYYIQGRTFGTEEFEINARLAQPISP